METDRELLELAAKAAGIDYIEYDGLGLRRALGFHENEIPCVTYWNPLEDDGDALRLAVKLRIEPKHVGDESWAVVRGEICKIEFNGSDPYAATRRAIVRAAAEIGRTMK